MPKYPHKHHRSLHSEIKHVVEDELKETTELKRLNIVTTDTTTQVDNTGFYNDLSLLPKATTTSDSWKRLGDVVFAHTLRIRLLIQSMAPTAEVLTWKDGTALVRYIIFSWAPYEEAATFQASTSGVILDLLQGPGAGYEVLAPYVTQGLKGQFKVHVDETVPLYAAAGGITTTTGGLPGYQWWPKMEFREHHVKLGHLMDFTASADGSVGAGKVYMLVLSNEQDSTVTPSVQLNSMLYFTDS